MAKLTFFLEDDQEVVVPLAGHITIGRAEDNDVQVDDERISKHHGEIIDLGKATFEVRDLGSVAGTLVNDVPIKNQVLKHGDTVSFGPLTGTFDAELETAVDELPKTVTTRVLTKAVPIKTTKVAVDRVEAVPAVAAQVLAADEASLSADIAKLQSELKRLKDESALAEQELEEWRLKAAKERNAHENRLSTLRSAEERLLPIQAAAKHAESTHSEWLAAIQRLSVEHSECSKSFDELLQKRGDEETSLAKLQTEKSSVEKELETLASRQSEATANLSRLAQETAEAELLIKQRKDAAEQEQARLESLQAEQMRLKESVEAGLSGLRQEQERQLAEEKAAHEDQILRLQTEYGEWQRKITAAQDTQAAHAELATAAVEKLGLLQRQIADAEATARHIQTENSSLQSEYEAATQQLTKVTESVREAMERVAELEAQHRSLALTDQEIGRLNGDLASLVQQHSATQLLLSEATEALSATETLQIQQTSRLHVLEQDILKAEARVAGLTTHQAKLETEAAALNSIIEEHRGTVEQIRRHAEEHERVKLAIEAARSELADLTGQLVPLRDWKASMDQLYARFAATPQGTPESQAIWKEIETGKAMLVKHILSLQTRVPRIMHVEFSRRGVKPTTPMKSERVQGKGS